jgi:hypothetical protein
MAGMTDADLDRSYTALCESLAQVGPEKSELFLAMVVLGLLARAPEAPEALALIERVRERCLAEGADAGQA